MPEVLQNLDPQKLVWWTWLAENLQNIVLAVVVLIAGWLFGNFLTRWVGRLLNQRHVDPTLAPFLASIIGIGFKVLLVISVAGMVGIQTTSFVAVLGAVGFAVGLALQGNLANFAGGVLILIRKPFVVGNYIEAQGVSGTVSEINIFSTVLITPDNLKVYVPNGPLASGNLTNYSGMDTRRLVWDVGIAYSASIEKAKRVAMEVITSDPRVLKDPEPQAWVVRLNDNSVDLSFRAWATHEDYWFCFFENLEKIKLAFDEAGIDIPFPQRTVHIDADFIGKMKKDVLGQEVRA